ncbi:MAG: hypothetical protein R3C13_08075 [Hyphomonas sp.]|uniref:hypothetical protein n=1 Tax=Hyphomonas sp. TaxID=87 RepID=UPI0035283DCA
MARLAMIVIACTALLAACVTRDPYPEDWASPDVTLGCPALDGTFEQVGVEAGKQSDPKSGSNILLSHILRLNDDLTFAAHANADRTVLSKSGDMLTIEARAGSEVVTSWSIELNEAECEGGWQIYQDARSGIVGSHTNAVTGMAWKKVRLSRAQDGALVVEATEGGVGAAFLVIPVAGQDSALYRFEARDE